MIVLLFKTIKILAHTSSWQRTVTDVVQTGWSC